jgi:hypothetical protein
MILESLDGWDWEYEIGDMVMLIPKDDKPTYTMENGEMVKWLADTPYMVVDRTFGINGGQGHMLIIRNDAGQTKKVNQSGVYPSTK